VRPLRNVDVSLWCLTTLVCTKIGQENNPKKIHFGDFLRYITIGQNHRGHCS
jgi:hypothetical protein